MEKRRHRRIDLKDRGWRAELIDQIGGKKLGGVVSLSPNGLMLITPRALEPESLYQVRCEATSQDGDRHAFSAGIMVLWRSDASEKETYWTGMQIIDIDDDSRERLRTLSTAMTSDG